MVIEEIVIKHPEISSLGLQELKSWLEEHNFDPGYAIAILALLRENAMWRDSKPSSPKDILFE